MTVRDGCRTPFRYQFSVTFSVRYMTYVSIFANLVLSQDM